MSQCGEAPALVHPARALLAAGPGGVGRLPARVDPTDSIPVDGVLGLVRGIVMLPARLVSGPRAP